MDRVYIEFNTTFSEHAWIANRFINIQHFEMALSMFKKIKT